MKIQNNVSVYNGVYIEDDVFIGPSVVFTNVSNPRSFIERKDEFRSTRIQHGATIGANATILCGVTIAPFSMIGAGAVVVHDSNPFEIITGNPGKPSGWVSERGHKLVFSQDGTCFCSEESVTYVLDNGTVKKKG